MVNLFNMNNQCSTNNLFSMSSRCSMNSLFNMNSQCSTNNLFSMSSLFSTSNKYSMNNQGLCNKIITKGRQCSKLSQSHSLNLCNQGQHLKRRSNLI